MPGCCQCAMSGWAASAWSVWAVTNASAWATMEYAWAIASAWLAGGEVTACGLELDAACGLAGGEVTACETAMAGCTGEVMGWLAD